MTGTNSGKKFVYKTIGIILPLIMVLGGRSISGLRVAGLVLTPLRVCVPLVFVMLAVKTAAERKGTCRRLSKENRYTLSMSIAMLIWLLYGGLSLKFSQYSVTDTGLKELLAIMLSAMSALCIVLVCRHEGWDYVITGTKIAAAATLCIAIYEIATGNHLSTSRFCSPEYYQLIKETIGDKAGDIRIYLATSTFYNENDFTAFLAVIAPLFSADFLKKTRKIKVGGAFMLGLIAYVIYVDDAFICLIALATGVICTLAFAHAGVKEWISTILIMIVSSVLARLLSGAGALEASLLVQLNNRQNGTGSLLYRINTYTITLRETFVTSKGLGFGAGSYTNYFGPFAETQNMMYNPHCLWLEILSEYGVIVFLLFIAVLIAVFVALIKANKKERDIRYAMILGAGSSFIFASVAPSSYLQYAYFWIPIAMALYLADEYAVASHDSCIHSLV